MEEAVTVVRAHPAAIHTALIQIRIQTQVLIAVTAVLAEEEGVPDGVDAAVATVPVDENTGLPQEYSQK